MAGEIRTGVDERNKIDTINMVEFHTHIEIRGVTNVCKAVKITEYVARLPHRENIENVTFGRV